MVRALSEQYQRRSLSPRFGRLYCIYYETSELIDQAYRSFIAELEDKGVDMSHVKVGKSIAVSLYRSQMRDQC